MFCQLTQSKKGRIVYLVLIHIKLSEKQTKTTSLRSPPSKQQQQNEPVNKKKRIIFTKFKKKKKSLQDSFIIQVRRFFYASIISSHSQNWFFSFFFFFSYITINIHNDTCPHTTRQSKIFCSYFGLIKNVLIKIAFSIKRLISL